MIRSLSNAILRMLLNTLTSAIMSTPEMGALSSLRAAPVPQVKRGEYYGPERFKGLRGHPGVVQVSKTAADAKLAKRTVGKISRIKGR